MPSFGEMALRYNAEKAADKRALAEAEEASRANAAEEERKMSTGLYPLESTREDFLKRTIEHGEKIARLSESMRKQTEALAKAIVEYDTFYREDALQLEETELVDDPSLGVIKAQTATIIEFGSKLGAADAMAHQIMIAAMTMQMLEKDPAYFKFRKFTRKYNETFHNLVDPCDLPVQAYQVVTEAIMPSDHKAKSYDDLIQSVGPVTFRRIMAETPDDVRALVGIKESLDVMLAMPNVVSVAPSWPDVVKSAFGKIISAYAYADNGNALNALEIYTSKIGIEYRSEEATTLLWACVSASHAGETESRRDLEKISRDLKATAKHFDLSTFLLVATWATTPKQYYAAALRFPAAMENKDKIDMLWDMFEAKANDAGKEPGVWWKSLSPINV